RLRTQSYRASLLATFFCAANPGHACLITRAPRPAAICCVPSVEPASTTMISSATESERMARAMFAASLCVMMVAETGGMSEGLPGARQDLGKAAARDEVPDARDVRSQRPIGVSGWNDPAHQRARLLGQSSGPERRE